MKPDRETVVNHLRVLSPYSYPEEREALADAFLAEWDDAVAAAAYLEAWANEPRWRAYHAAWVRGDGGRKS